MANVRAASANNNDCHPTGSGTSKVKDSTGQRVSCDSNNGLAAAITPAYPSSTSDSAFDLAMSPYTLKDANGNSIIPDVSAACQRPAQMNQQAHMYISREPHAARSVRNKNQHVGTTQLCPANSAATKPQ